MRILWTHNFNPQIPNSGRFMHILAEGVRLQGLTVELMYLGSLGSVRGLLHARQQVSLKSQFFDITHAQFGSACAMASVSARGIKVLSLRGSDWYRYRGDNWSEYRHSLLAVNFTKLSIRSFHGVVVMSDRMATEVKASLSAETPLLTLPDPVDTVNFIPRSRDKARCELGFSGDYTPWVLFTTLSKSNPVKRFELARRSVELAAKNVPGLKLKVATGIDHEKMPTFVSSCNIALCTSTHEGWPNSIKEAIACGLPFVSTDVSDLQAIAELYGSCKICPADEYYLSEAIVKVLTSEVETKLHEAVQYMDVDSTSKRLAEFYSTLQKK